MALPTGYDQIPWHMLKGGDEVYILEDGRAKPYGPYKVIDPNTRLVDDISTVGGFSTGQFNIGPNEIVGKPSTGTTTTTQPGTAYSQPAPGSLAPDTMIGGVLVAMRDWIVTDIASKAQNIDAATRARLENEANIKRNIAETKLTDWKRMP